jgi:hypothetical protein
MGGLIIMKRKMFKESQESLRVAICSLLLILLFVIVLCHFFSCADYKEAGVRTNITAVRAKQKELAQEIEKYKKENGKLPFGEEGDYPQLFHIPEGFKEVFSYSDGKPFDPFQDNKERFYFARVNPVHSFLISPGPDKKMDIDKSLLKELADLEYDEIIKRMKSYEYDSTNGIISSGDIFRGLL